MGSCPATAGGGNQIGNRPGSHYAECHRRAVVAVDAIARFAHLAAIYKGVTALAFAAFLLVHVDMANTPARQKSLAAVFRFGPRFCILPDGVYSHGTRPGLLAPELNVDESLFLAGAQKLQHDVVYWRAVDVGLSGPLNVYPLMLPALLGFKLEYAAPLPGSAAGRRYVPVPLPRCANLGGVARTALVPVVTTYALMTASDYVHYSSEHVPVALISVAICLVCRLASSGAGGGNITMLFIGLLLGAAPYAKLQATPIAAAVGCICLHIIWSRRSSTRQAVRSALALGSGSASFSVVHLVFVVANALQETFLRSYVLQNLNYSKFSTSVGDKASNFVHVTVREQDSRALFGLAAATLIVGLPVLIACAARSQPELTGRLRRRQARRIRSCITVSPSWRHPFMPWLNRNARFIITPSSSSSPADSC